MMVGLTSKVLPPSKDIQDLFKRFASGMWMVR